MFSTFRVNRLHLLRCTCFLYRVGTATVSFRNPLKSCALHHPLLSHCPCLKDKNADFLLYFFFHFTLKLRAAFDMMLLASSTAAPDLKHAYYLLDNAGHLKKKNEVVVRVVAPGPLILHLAPSIAFFLLVTFYFSSIVNTEPTCLWRDFICGSNYLCGFLFSCALTFSTPLAHGWSCRLLVASIPLLVSTLLLRIACLQDSKMQNNMLCAQHRDVKPWRCFHCAVAELGLQC